MNSLALIHIAKKEFKLDDDTFRDGLERVTGKRSLRAMSERQRIAVVDDFKAKGFVVKRGGKPVGKSSPKSSKGYIRLIYALWCKRRSNSRPQ